MYTYCAKEIWINPEKRLALTKGSKKYKLNKDKYELRQVTMSVTEFYTSLKSVWEELDSLNLLPSVANQQPDVACR